MPRVVNPSSATNKEASAAADDNNGDGGLLKPPPLPEPAIVTTATTAAAAGAAATTAAVTITTASQKKTLQRSLKTSIQFKSDLSKSTRSTASSGILHASITSSPPTVGGIASAAAGAVNTTSSTSGAAAVKEEHCFVWISNLFHLDKALDHLKKFGFYNDGDAVSPSAADEDAKPAAISGAAAGSEGSISNNNSSTNLTFIPYSSRSNWCYKYPMAFPNIHVDINGNVSGYPYWSSEGSAMMQNAIPFGNASAIGTTATSSTSLFGGLSGGAIKSGGAPFQLLANTGATTAAAATTVPTLPPLPTLTIGTGSTEKLFPTASLSNMARSQLHSQIYSYFNWLKNELVVQQQSSLSANTTMMDSNHLIHGIGNLLLMMESTFGESVSANSTAAAAAAAAGGGKKRRASSQSMMAMMEGEDAPLLERGLIEPLNQLVAESTAATSGGSHNHHDVTNEDDSSTSSPKRRKTQKTDGGSSSSGNGRGAGAGSGGNAPLDFDDMYNRLLAFKAQFGHVNVPQGYKEDKQLGSWVTNIRYKRKCLQKAGQDYEVDDEEDTDLTAMSDFDTAAAAANMMGIDFGTTAGGTSNTRRKDGAAGTGKPKRKKKRLSQERIAQLDNVGFAWSHDKQYKSWDERFNDLQEYKRVNGNTRVPRSSGSLGEWVHMQRKMYHKNDKNFMAKRAPRLEAIGFEWRTRKYDLVSWDDNFQNLVKFGTENQHYNVPSPIDANDEAGGSGATTHEQEEANRFYKWVKRTRSEYKSLMSGKSSRMLTEERVAKLRQIGFIV
ncbi:hypothetical protein ACHAWT_007636 [Skeletonema menzelii]